MTHSANEPILSFSRIAVVVAFTMWLIMTPNFASAQVLSTYDSGYPIQTRIVSIAAGETVRFRTDYNLEPAPGVPEGGGDSVLSLVEIGGGFLAGADGWDCRGAIFTWASSCFTYTNNTSRPKAAYLIARAWAPATAARTRLWRDNRYLPDHWNGNSIDKVYLGGGWVTHTLATDSRQHISTGHRPGGAINHVMVIGSSDRFGAAEVAHQLVLGQSRTVWGLAEIDQRGLRGLPSPRVSIAFGGANNSNEGPLRLFQNDWFLPFADYDGDGLSHDLEVDLGTCDRTSNMTPDGESCSSFEFCTSNPTSSVCLAHLRDTDHDGLRDDLEVYGYNDPQAHLARYGADPLHRDVFIEMNTVDRIPGGECDGFTANDQDRTTWPSRMGGERDRTDNNFFNRMQRIFDNAPAELNRDGTPGISLHFDVGISNPDTLSTAWNDWGGGGDCLAEASASACNADMEADRSWLFRCAIDISGGGGQAAGQGWYANTTAHHVHELGHVLGLGHGGGIGSAANTINSANRRPLYNSRINYRYQDVGIDGTGVWDEISFSPGTLSIPSSARFSPETEPVPGQNLSFIREGNPEENADDRRISGVWDVDWNLDGAVTNDKRVWETYRDQENGRNARGYKSRDPHENLLMGNYGNHIDAAIVNEVLVFAFTESNRIYFMANSDGKCEMYPTSPNLGEREVYSNCMELGARFYTSHSGNAVSVARTLLPVPGNPPTEGMVMVYRQGKFLHWREVDVIANPGASSKAGFRISDGGMLTNMGTGLHEVTLAEIPASTINPHGGVMALLTVNGGNLQQAHLPAGSSGWSSFNDVQLASGGTLGPVAGDVGTVAHKGLLYMATRKTNESKIRIYKMPAGSDQRGKWTEISSFDSRDADAVEIAFTPPPTNEAHDEFFVFYREPSGGAAELKQRRTRDLNMNSWSDEQTMGLTSREYAFGSAAVVYDDRMVANGAHGLRAFRNIQRGCANNQPWSCNDSGYHPGTMPGELSCDATFCVDTPPTGGVVGELGGVCPARGCNSGLTCATLSGSDLPVCVDSSIRSYIQYSPFAEGHNPTEYCDYNDWDQIGWYMCEGLTNLSAPTTAPAGEPYQLTPNPGDVGNVRCGNRHVYAEPTETGMCATSYSTTLSDRSLFPGYYR